MSDSNSLPKLDRSAFSIRGLYEPDDEKSYWLQKTPQERLEALEQMRQVLYGYDPDTTRLQRVLTVTERPSSRIEDVMDGIKVQLINLEDLKQNKKASGRNKDLNDLENLP